MRCLGFTLAGEYFGVETHMVQEIIQPSAVIPVPNAPDFIRGVINFRSRLVPVLDAAKKLNLTPTAPPGVNRKIVIVNIQGTPAGIPVDSISGIHEPDDSMNMSAEPAADSATDHYRKGVCRVEGRQMNILDLPRLLDADERGQLETMGSVTEGLNNG